MGEARRYRLVMYVTIHDHEALRVAAAEQAAQEGMSEAEWSNLRFGPAEDLVMLIDQPCDGDLGYQVEEIEIDFDLAETERSGRIN